MRILLKLTLANLKMIMRNRQAMFWSMAFPLMFVVIFGLFFRGQSDGPSSIAIAVVDNAQDDMSAAIVNGLTNVEPVKVTLRNDEAVARREIIDGDLGFLLVLSEGLEESVESGDSVTLSFLFNQSSSSIATAVAIVERQVTQANFAIAETPLLLELEPESLGQDDFDFLAFLLPGLAIWGVMSYSVIGLGTTIATYREKNILKRILATPLNVKVFFGSQILAYLVLSVIQSAIIFGVGTPIFGVSFGGNILEIAVAILLGNLVFLNFGFLVGTFSKTVQAASGLGNAVVLPLMFFSGVFFPTDSLPIWLSTAIRVLPLAPLLDMLRGVTIESRHIWEYPIELATLVVWIALTGLLAIKLFRFR